MHLGHAVDSQDASPILFNLQRKHYYINPMQSEHIMGFKESGVCCICGWDIQDGLLTQSCLLYHHRYHL